MPERGKSPSRPAYTVYNRKSSSRNTTKDAYNKACEAVDEYNFQHPGTNITLDPLNEATNDAHTDADVAIPLRFTQCDNLTAMGDELSSVAHTNCYLSYETRISSGKADTVHVLHIDPRGLYDRPGAQAQLLHWFLMLPRTVRLVLAAILCYMLYRAVWA